jgi:hypothetical protein
MLCFEPAPRICTSEEASPLPPLPEAVSFRPKKKEEKNNSVRLAKLYNLSHYLGETRRADFLISHLSLFLPLSLFPHDDVQLFPLSSTPRSLHLGAKPRKISIRSFHQKIISPYQVLPARGHHSFDI